jgi:SSS family solute:Na+ symporter
LLLAIALFFTYCGGHIAVMVTDFLQAMLCNIVMLIIMTILIVLIPWDTIIEGLASAPENASMINPFKTSETETYDFWFFAIWAINFIYMFPAWQGQQAYYSAAKSPHETRMARILGNVRGTVTYNAILVIPIVAYVIMHHPNFSDIAASVNNKLSILPSEYYQQQMIVPAVIHRVIPIGLFGFFIAAMLGAMISTLDTLLHAWGSIFVQDVVLPFRKKPFEAKTHMLLLRLATLGVAIFIFCFSIFYKQKQDIWLFWAMIGSFYYAGAGIALALGLYWKRGTTLGAWAGLITGIILTAIVWYSLEQLPVGQTTVKWVLGNMEFDLNAQHFSIIIAVAALISYVIFSLIKPAACNFDKLFHQGQYALDDDMDEEQPDRRLGWLGKVLGINKYFTKGDRVIYYVIMLNVVITVAAVIMISIIQLFTDLSDRFWSIFWLIYVWNIIVAGTLITVWFLIGGIFDLKELFRRLATARRNDLDDGMVVGHQNLDEEKANQE